VKEKAGKELWRVPGSRESKAFRLGIGSLVVIENLY